MTWPKILIWQLVFFLPVENLYHSIPFYIGGTENNTQSAGKIQHKQSQQQPLWLLLVASPKAVYCMLTLSLCVCECVCHSIAVVKTPLNSEWLSQRGQVQRCVYDPTSVCMCELYCVCLCACGANRQNACLWLLKPQRWSAQSNCLRRYYDFLLIFCFDQIIFIREHTCPDIHFCKCTPTWWNVTLNRPARMNDNANACRNILRCL